MEAKQKLSGKNRKGKLSLKRKNTSKKEDSDDSITGNQKGEVLKAISGEFSLNQSEDFRDASKSVRLQLKKSNPKLLKKSLPRLSRSKSNAKLNPSKNDSALGTASSRSESKNDKVRNSENDKKSKQVNEENQRTNNVDTEETTNDSSITSCKVLLSKIPMACDAPETATRSTCPVCHKHIRSNTGSQGMQDHINLCLKKHFSAIGDTSEDAYLAQQLHEREQEKAMEENLTESEFYPCQLCHKDLSRMNSTRRLQHMNRCIDVIENEVQEREKIKKDASKRMIPDCPMCGVKLNTKLQRESHLKRCARALEVPSAQLIEIVKRQEQEFASHADKQPQSEIQGQSTSSTTIAQPNLPRPQSRPKKKRKKPGEGLDDETQLAMAMSASLAPQQSTSEVPDVSDSNGPVKQKRSRKKKNADTEIPVLLVRSEAERQRMLEDRLARLVAPQEVQNLDKTPSLRRSRVAEKHAKQSRSSGGKGTFQRQSSLLWGLSAQDDPKLVSRTPFYVSQLKPVIAPGHIKTASKETPAKQAKSKNNDEVSGTQTISSTLQVLMDLEEEGTHASSPSIEGSGDSRQETIGFLGNPKAALQVSKPVDEHEKVVLQQLASLINCEKLSDIKIKTTGGSIVHAHSLLLHLRCPKLLQHLNENASNRSCTLDIPKDVLLAILKYVYCGSIDVDGTIALDVLRFAQNYDLTDLARSCQPILKTRTTPHKSSNKCDKEGGDVDLGNSKMQMVGDDEVCQEKDLDELIQSLWDDSDDDHDESKNSCKDSESENEASDSCPNEADMQEIYEYASTQAKQTKQAETHRSEVINQKTAIDNSTEIEGSLQDVNSIKSADSTADDVNEETNALCVVNEQPRNSSRSPSHQSQESPKIVSSTKSAESAADNVNDETNVLSVVDIQPTNSTRSDQGQENIQANIQKIPSATGRLTRRGWKPFPVKEMSKKPKTKVNANNSSDGGATQPTNSTTFRITDDYNEQDIEMEDLSEDAEMDPDGNGNKANEPNKAASRKDASTSVPKNSEGQPTKDTERVLDLTQNLPPSSPVTRSSLKKKESSQKKQTPHKTRQPSEKVASTSCIASESGVVDKVVEGNSENQLDESTDESDTSWIIPNTPPAKPSNTMRKTFVPPRASQSRFSQGFSFKQNTSALTASTPIDMRNRMGSFVGSSLLPQISPVKVVLEKLPLSTSSPALTGSIHLKSKGVDTHTEATDQGSGIEQSSFNDKNINCAITPSKHTQLDNEESNTPLENKAQTRQNQMKSVLERSSESSFPARRRTRSSSQTPVKEVPRKKLTIKGSLQKKLKDSPNGSVSKASQRKDDSPSQKDKVASTPTRRSRRISVTSSDKRTPDSSRGRTSIVIPDAVEVSTPVVLSDESPSPTPSPKFGGTSSIAVPTSISKDDILDNPIQDELLLPDEHTDKPSKRKRKQSMPMRSPDRLNLTVNDAPVNVAQTNKLKLNAGKLKARTKVPYSSPKIRKSPPYFPLKKKYKSFTPLRSQSKMRRRTRSMSKGTPVMGNKSRNNTQNVEKACHDNSGCTSGRKATPTKDKETKSSSQVDDHKMNGSETFQENGAFYQEVASDLTISEEQPSDDDTNEDQVVLVGSTPSVTDENVTDNGNDQMEEEARFAFDVDDGGFDGFNNFPGSHHDDDDDDDDLNRGEQQDISNIIVPQVRSPNGVSVPTSRHHSNSKILTHIPKVSSPPENQSPIPFGLENILKIDTPRVRPPPETNQQNGSQIDFSKIRSPPEVRIPQVGEKERFGKELWTNLYVTPARSTSNVVSPVITEKVITLENYTALSRQPRIEENGDTICFANAELLPSHRHATASPTLQEHIFSSSQSVTSPVACENEVGYFGVGSDSFMMEMQDEVFETRVGANECVFANGNEEESPFVPPPIAMQNINHNVAIVRPTPIRPNIDDQYHPPGPITPMPNYEDMDTPALRKETFKYGLKPLHKKQARLKLKEIYEYTHQVLETSLDDDSNSNQNEHAASKTTASKSKKVAKPKAKEIKKAKGHRSHSLAPGSGDKSGSDGAAKDSGSKGSSPTKQKEGGQGESSGETSDALSYNDCPEDSILGDGDDDEIPMSQPLSKNPEEAVFAYIKGNTALYQKILMYEPLFIKEFQKELKEAGIYCSMDQLKVILDKQCITFRAEAGVNRHVRKSKKKKTK